MRVATLFVVAAIALSLGAGCSGEGPEGDCKPGDSRACFSGSPQTKGKGLCKEGLSTCTPNRSWGACIGEGKPTKELCDGQDNNCDGKTDEGCDCKDGTSQACGSNDKGTCKKGSQTCKDGKWSTCKGEVNPTKEICDGLDNNCDGKTDEGCQCKNGATRECGKEIGECAKGIQTCSDGKWGECVGERKPAKEICDGVDNNCDGKIDEGCQCKNGVTRECGNEIGECAKGIQTCSDGKWSTCKGEVKPAQEICDGKDNNCDGKTDEGCDCLNGAKRPCGSNNVGLCKKGTQTCKDGKWEACVGEVKPDKEICDGKDNNCDGKTDEGCQCKPGSQQPCGTSKGTCTQGSQTCSSKGIWEVCVGGSKPTTETCDGKDNDCDGSVDEALTQTCKTACGSGQILCQSGKIVPCNAPKPLTETCDGKDNDCDGKTDEGCQCRNGVTRPCGADAGECKKGTQTCKSGKWDSCVGGVKPTTETCDGKDNNCDGKTDEGCQCRNGVTRPCGTDTGECKKGTQTCKSGKWGSCTGAIQSRPEVCDGIDNDCNGQIDNGTLCPSGQVCQGTGGCKATGPKPLYTGTFVNASYKVSGTLAIYKDTQGERVVLGSTFKTDPGPDLKVYLTTDSTGNASVGSFLNLGVLKSTSGTQIYRLPTGKTSASYKAVVIWCQRFSAKFGYATLK